jgi:ribose transport system substrate-binding protein
MRFLQQHKQYSWALACLGAFCITASLASVASASGSTPAGVTYAKQQLAKYEKLQSSWTAPGPALKDVKKKLHGKTVWYVPIFLQAPYFTADSTDLAQVLGLVGAHLHICDAASNPSTATTCINEAVAAKSAAIVTDAMNYSFASAAMKAAIKAKIPIVATDNDDAEGFPKTKDLVTVSHDLPLSAGLAADWIIANSDGKANVLYAADNSDDGTIEGTAVRAEFKEHCPGCTVTIVPFSDATTSDLTTTVPAAMVSHPNINYIYAGYDAPSGVDALQGAQTLTGRQYQFVGFTGQPPGMERVAAGTQAVDPGNDNDDAMYNTADALFRLVTGAKPVKYTTYVRIFTKQNLPSDAGNAAAYASGAWYSSNEPYKKGYMKLWGL